MNFVIAQLALLTLVAAAATQDLTFKYYIFESKCYSLFFEKHDFLNFPCLKLVQPP
jgi:hypothetical protein